MGSVEIRVRVTPRSSRTEVSGIAEGVVQMRVSAPPVDGAANRAVIETLASLLDIPRSAITLRRGQSGRDKTFVLSGITDAQLKTQLERWENRLKHKIDDNS